MSRATTENTNTSIFCKVYFAFARKSQKNRKKICICQKKVVPLQYEK